MSSFKVDVYVSLDTVDHDAPCVPVTALIAGDPPTDTRGNPP